MAQSLYITGTESGSGKSVVALGVMETLAGRAQKAGFFRPIVGGGQPDPEIELMRGRYRLESSYQEMHALTVDEAHHLMARGAHEEPEQRVFDAYKHLERRFEIMVVEGTDFTGVLPVLNFELNATLANQLGCSVLVSI
jgi:phosphate acetyltransferase